ncbi:hypothetical protein PCANC_14437 [Puccinia coronata f. sp. avenae]|uniref:DUF7872 domain-containing protein n=1 Tax=Puccinia coronata f. sp. avenae TaxID=200324 RepID=A0A2N5SHK8_9BASI|nr:hypothetical protein PCANC_14437 [Puccinia coronata f. sp. avenae]
MSLRVETMFGPSKRFSVRTYLVPGMCVFLSLTAALIHSQNQLQLQSTCDPLPFTQETWKNRNIDKYISEYPGGHNLTVNEYAAKVGAKNFRCGISQWCNAGQMCYPAKGLDWYVLFAIQEWRERVNDLYAAVGFTMSLMLASLFGITLALFPQPDNLRIFSQKVHFAMGAAVASMVVLLLPAVLAFIGMFEIFIKWVTALVMIPATLAGLVSAAKRYKEAPKEAFGLASEINYHITSYQEQAQESLRNQTKTRLNAPISSPEGMAGALLGGSYLDPTQFRSIDQIEDELKNITLAASVGRILKSLNAFVTIGSDPCSGGGKDGVWSGDNVLSYCNLNGTMFNIVTVSPGKSKVKNHILNAEVLSSKFGITTEYLTSSAIKCRGTRTTTHTNSTLRSADFKQRKKKLGQSKHAEKLGYTFDHDTAV